MHGRRNSLNPSTERGQRKRRLAKETRRDPVSYSDLPLPKSIKSEVIAGLGLTVRRGADEMSMTTAQWRKRSGLLIAQALVRMLIEKNGNKLRYEKFLAFLIRELSELSDKKI
jgi:hypothetical protein